VVRESIIFKYVRSIRSFFVVLTLFFAAHNFGSVHSTADNHWPFCPCSKTTATTRTTWCWHPPAPMACRRVASTAGRPIRSNVATTTKTATNSAAAPPFIFKRRDRPFVHPTPPSGIRSQITRYRYKLLQYGHRHPRRPLKGAGCLGYFVVVVAAAVAATLVPRVKGRS